MLYLLMLSEVSYFIVYDLIDYLSVAMVVFILCLLHVEDYFHDDGKKDNNHSNNLFDVDAVSKMNYIYNYSHTFSCCYHERDYMLFE